MYWSGRKLLTQILSKQMNIIINEYPGAKRQMLLDNITKEVVMLFREDALKNGLSFTYIFNMKDQKGCMTNIDGVWNAFIFPDSSGMNNIKKSTIGIAAEALDKGKDYATALFIHEFTHLALSEENHSQEFYTELHKLVHKYNLVTGKKIKAI